MNVPDVPIQVDVNPNEDTEWYVRLLPAKGLREFY
jgi:hypothetical protein